MIPALILLVIPVLIPLLVLIPLQIPVPLLILFPFPLAAICPRSFMAASNGH